MKIKGFKEKYSRKVRRKPAIKRKEDFGWVFIASVSAFWISFSLSLVCETIIPNANFFIAVFITLLFIFLGIIFDMIGVSVTVADLKTFNSMSAKKVRGARLASKFVRNNEKTSSFCNDVIGDICGIISGGASVVVASIIASSTGLNPLISTLIVTSTIASLTVGGKAIGKSIAINNSTRILYGFARFVSIFTRG